MPKATPGGSRGDEVPKKDENEEQISGGAASATAIEVGDESEEEEKEEEKTEEHPQLSTEKSSGEKQMGEPVLSDGSEEGDDLTIDDIVLDTSRISKIDLQAVFALPPHLQKDMINRILSDRRQEVRDKFIPLAGKPEAYSHTQLSAFLATTALHRRIEAAKQKNRDQIEGIAADGGATNSELGPGKRIASRSDRFFVYKRAEDRVGEASDDEERKSDTEGTGDVVGEIDSAANEARSSSLADADDTFIGDAGTNGFPLLTRFKNKKRQYRDEEEMGRRSLSDFSVGSMKEFTIQAQRQQTRKLMVQEAATAWAAKNQVQSKHEPTLAIEEARRKRLKIEEPVEEKTSESSAVAVSSADDKKSFTISFKIEDADVTGGEHLNLFPASMFETNTKAEVTAPTEHSAANTDEGGASESVGAEEDDADDDVGAW